ncbi:hypothetical protein GBAR_LOCUS13201, partial [Geodia barretti]
QRDFHWSNTICHHRWQHGSALRGTEYDINTSCNEAYGAVTSNGERESGHVTTHSNEAYCATRRT